jgi:hypothetical protein
MRNASRVIKVAVLLALAAAALGAIAGSASAKKFMTPDGNVSCLMRSKFVRCDITKHFWESPPKPKSCEFDYGSTLGLNKRGKAKWLCVSDAIGAKKKLDAGTKVEVGPYRCSVRKKGVVCKYGNSGGFKLTKTHWQIF